MAQLLIRGLSPDTVERLKARARAHGRSLQAEARHILAQTAQTDPDVFWTAADRLSRQLEGSDRSFSDSATLIREDRDR